MAFVQYIPQYVFCHYDAFLEDPALYRLMETTPQNDNHHELCTSSSVSLDKRLASAFKDVCMPKKMTISPRSIELMYEPFQLRLSVLGVSHQLREEAMEVYYKTNIFSFATATGFNIFISRLTDEKASLLTKMELMYDRGHSYFIGGREWREPSRWCLGVQNIDILSRLVNVTDITIGCFMTKIDEELDSGILEAIGLHLRLKRYFGGLRGLKRVARVSIQAYERKSRMLLDDVSLRKVCDIFAREVLGGEISDVEDRWALSEEPLRFPQ